MRSLFVLAIVILAGCAGAPADDVPASKAAHGSVIGAPQWSIGDYWTFNNMAAGGDASIVTIVVTGESGGEWLVDTNEQSHALYDARSDISYLGEVRKSDLAGSQGSDRVQFFDFPLEENKTWRTTWDGRSLDVVVEQAYADRALLKAYDGDALYVEYEFSIERGFFEYVTFYDDNGTEAFRMDASDHGSDYTGTVYRYTVYEPIQVSGAGGPPTQAPFNIEDGVTEIAVTMHASCDQPGRYRVALQGPEDGQEDMFPAWQPVSQPEYLMEGNCPGAGESIGSIEARAGPWRVDALLVEGAFDVTIEPRTLEMIPVG